MFAKILSNAIIIWAMRALAQPRKLNCLKEEKKMFRKLLFLSLCLSSPLLGQNHSIPQGESMQIGRYQMTAVTDIHGVLKFYLLDTATGRVWKSITKNNWLEHDAWEPQIITSPDNL